MGRFAWHYVELTSLLIICSHDAYAEYVKENGRNDCEFHRMFWFVEGEMVIDKTLTSVARLADLRTNQGPIIR